MAKNVRVRDESGREYAPTYAKRARGLVRQGRARFVEQDVICLTRPPRSNQIDWEENTMQDMNSTDRTRNEQAAQHITQKELLDRIDAIMAQSTELHTLVGMMSQVDQGQAMAMSNAIEAREHTNRQMLKMLQQMYQTEQA